MPGVAFLWPWSLLAAFVDFLAAIVVISIAGGRGAANRVVGVLGGVAMLASPVIAFALVNSTALGLT